MYINLSYHINTVLKKEVFSNRNSFYKAFKTR